MELAVSVLGDLEHSLAQKRIEREGRGRACCSLAKLLSLRCG